MVRNKLCRVEEIPQGQSLGIKPSGGGKDDMFLVNYQGQIYAYRNSCPHWPGSTMPVLRNKYLDEGAQHIVCHGHGALFDIRSGLCVKGPCLGQALTSVALEVTKAGDIYLLEDLQSAT